jgi:transcriptional regulator with XRE-family HTH domain
MESIKKLREQKGMRLAKLAVLADMDPATLWRYETGKRSPSVERLEKLAEVLEVEVIDFFPKAQAPLPLEEEVAGASQVWAEYINEHATDVEEWAYGFHKGGDPAELPEREFLAFIGGVSVATEEYRRIGKLTDALYREAGGNLDEDLGRAYRRLSRAMLAMVTPGVEKRMEQLEPGALPDNVIHLQDRKTA